VRHDHDRPSLQASRRQGERGNRQSAIEQRVNTGEELRRTDRDSRESCRDGRACTFGMDSVRTALTRRTA
jgi:hypothetical protein